MMPDAELSVVGKRIAQETSIVGRTRERYRLALSCGIDNSIYPVTEVTRCGIEIDTAEIIADGVQCMNTLGESLCRTIIERTTISREDGEGLIDGVLLEQGRQQQLVFLNVIDLKVGGGIKDLDTVAVSTVEELARGIGRIGDIAARGMPVRIDTETKRLIGLGVIGNNGAVVVT